MRWRTTIALGMLGAAVATPDLAQAQFSPQGLIGGITRPFRQMLGHLGHYPRGHRHRTAAADSQAAAGAPSNEMPAPQEHGLAGPALRPGQTPTRTFSALHSGRTTMHRACAVAALT